MSSNETTAYDILPVGVLVVDRSLRVLTWNATIAKWSGVSPCIAIGQQLEEFLPDFRSERFKARLASVFEDGQSAVLSAAMHEQVFPLKKASGHLLFHKVHANALSAGSGEALIVVEDVTTSVTQLESLRAERRLLKESERSLRRQSQELTETNAALVEAQSRVEKSSRAKSEFLANMSHEVRTPLTAIKGFSEAVLANSDTPFVKDAAERVVRNAEHLLSIVNDILDLSKIEAGKMRLVIEPFSPSMVLESTLSLLECRAEAKRLALTSSIGPGAEALIASDPVRLRQALVNLIDNAIKFTDSGSVDVTVERVPRDDANDEIRFTVTDTGEGIATDKLGEIFRPFVQEDASTQRRHGGTGLGLAITRQIVEQLGGEIDASSEQGVGSTFVFSIAAIEPEDLPTEATVDETQTRRPQRRENDALPLGGRRILVAEDGPDNQMLIEYHLQRAGADSVIVENGSLAVEAIRSGSECFDAILLDMQMPVMDGYTAATTLRSEGAKHPVVALTASAMHGDRQKALSAGCDEYLPKPIDSEQLIDLLAHLIDERAVALASQADTLPAGV